MCDPISFTSFAISAATSAAQYGGAMQDYRDHEQFRADNAQRATDNAINQYHQSQRRMIQEEEAAAAEKAEVGREARAARATATVAAGEGGVSGLSVDALLADFYGREASYKDRINQNSDWTLEQLNNEMFGIKAQAEDRIASVRPMRAPSMLATGLKIAGSGMGSYQSYVDRTSAS